MNLKDLFPTPLTAIRQWIRQNEGRLALSLTWLCAVGFIITAIVFIIRTLRQI